MGQKSGVVSMRAHAARHAISSEFELEYTLLISSALDDLVARVPCAPPWARRVMRQARPVVHPRVAAISCQDDNNSYQLFYLATS